MKKNEMNEIIKKFFNYDFILEQELKKYIYENFPEKKDKLYHYYLTDLYKNHFLYRYDIGKFKLCKDRKSFVFSELNDFDVRKGLEGISPSIVMSYWELTDLKKYMSLQSFSNIRFIETYSYATEIVVNILLSHNKKVVLEKDYNTFIKYNNIDEIYVVRNMNDEVPILRDGFTSTMRDTKSYIVSPKIEKIIVDIIVDELFITILSDEIGNILVELLKRYKVNISTIRRYATKKHRLDKVLNTIESTGFNIDEGEFK